jgi:hypothetical protein
VYLVKGKIFADWIKKKRGPMRDSSSPARWGWFDHDPVQDHHFLIGEAGKRFLVGFQHLFASLGSDMHPQSIRQGFRDDNAQVHFSGTGNTFGLREGI